MDGDTIALMIVSLAGITATAAVGIWSAKNQSRDTIRARRADAYHPVLVTVERSLAWVAWVNDGSPPVRNPPEVPTEREMAEAQAYVMLHGTPAVRVSWETFRRRFAAVVGEADQRERAGKVDDEHWASSFREVRWGDIDSLATLLETMRFATDPDTNRPPSLSRWGRLKRFIIRRPEGWG